jgi:hypothetical protein
MKFEPSWPLVELAGFCLLILVAGIIDPGIGVLGF